MIYLAGLQEFGIEHGLVICVAIMVVILVKANVWRVEK